MASAATQSIIHNGYGHAYAFVTQVTEGVLCARDDLHVERKPQKFTRGELEQLVAAGLSIRLIAAELEVAPATIRKWLSRFGLETERSARTRQGRAARASGRRMVELTCRHHGTTEFLLEGRGAFRCLRCRQQAVTRRRRRVKEILVREAGGACQRCGYSRCIAALHFHHVDPASKQFSIAAEGATRSIRAARAEAAKCVLLCGNCHAEVEAERVGYA